MRTNWQQLTHERTAPETDHNAAHAQVTITNPLIRATHIGPTPSVMDCAGPARLRGQKAVGRRRTGAR